MSGTVLGLRANLGQFMLLVAVSALVGGMVGQERTVLPLLATEVFGIAGVTSALTFLFAFGLTKAFANLAAGALADRYGRRPVLIAGWLVGVPVPIILILAPDWSWVVAANVLLGINQGLTWSTTVIMKIDLVGPARRGLRDGPQRGVGLRCGRRHGARDRLDRRGGRVAARHRSCSGSRSRGWASPRRSCSCAKRPGTLPAKRRGGSPRSARPGRRSSG